MRALVIGSDGQDGYYLVRYLLAQGYQVYGVIRKKATARQKEEFTHNLNYHQIYADLTDFSSLIHAVTESNPDEIYNLAGQSAVPLSWEQPSLTADVNGLGVLRLLETIRLLKPDAKYLQSSTSEIFALLDKRLDENTPFDTRNPYGTAKLYGHLITKNYRVYHKLFACSAILFNHESPRRGLEFVTRKITYAAAKIKLGMQECLELGNLDAVRDWGSAEDYVHAMWLILQQSIPDDYVIASGVGHTVREFATAAFQAIGIELDWCGVGFDEVARDRKTGKVLVKVNSKLFRYPKEDSIIGNPEKILSLGFKPKKSFESLVEEIVRNDLAMLARSSHGQ